MPSREFLAASRALRHRAGRIDAVAGAALLPGDVQAGGLMPVIGLGAGPEVSRSEGCDVERSALPGDCLRNQLVEYRKVDLGGVPDDQRIDASIAMRQLDAHFIDGTEMRP